MRDPFLENPNNTCKQAQKAVIVYIQERGFIGVATTLYQLNTKWTVVLLFSFEAAIAKKINEDSPVTFPQKFMVVPP